jgi:FolB domain-containing protein
MRSVILDWSGTLVDDLGAVHAATNAVLKEFSVAELSLEQFRREFVLPLSTFYQKVLPGISFGDIDRRYHAHFANFRDSVSLLPGAFDFLEYCSAAGLELFVLSTMQADHFEAQATRFGVKRLFKKAYVGVPDKTKAILLILEENHLDPSETFLVGDTTHDLEAARVAGVLGAGVRTGFTTAEKLSAGDPDFIMRDLVCLLRFADIFRWKSPDEWIEIADLELEGRIGVSEAERSKPQRLQISLRFQIDKRFDELEDELLSTVDYAEVAAEAQRFALNRETRLVETLVSEIAGALMNRFPLRRLEIGLRKFILPDAKHVSVRTSRYR